MSLQWEVTRCFLCGCVLQSDKDGDKYCVNMTCEMYVQTQSSGAAALLGTVGGVCVGDFVGSSGSGSSGDSTVSSDESTVIDTNDSVVRHNNTPALEITRSMAEPSVVVVNTTCENMWEYLLHSGFLFESGFPHTCDNAENMVLGFLL